VSAGPAVSAADGVQPADADARAAPAAQLAHALPLNLYVAAGHAEQVAAPAREVVPAAQEEQEALSVPEFATTPKKLGAHAVHAATDVLPVAPPVVVTPTGHAVQDAAPEAAE
jgi:hypothetical protein